MVCSKKLMLLAVSLLIAASSAMGATVVMSGQTIAFITNGPTPTYSINSGASVNGVIENGAARFDFAGLDIQSGAIVTVTGANPLHLVSSDTITINTTVSVNGRDGLYRTSGGLSSYAGVAGPGGYAGAEPALPGSGPGGGGAPTPVPPATESRAGGGAGYGGVGGRNSRNMSLVPTEVDTNGNGGLDYGDEHVYMLRGGSGGGGGKENCGGGGGGGAIALTATAGNIVISASGVVTANGGAGTFPTHSVSSYRYGGGGGSGGVIRLDAGNGTVAIDGQLSAKGGHGANSLWMTSSGRTNCTSYHGGGGAGGRIAIYTTDSTYTNNGTITVAGGAGGTVAGSYASPLNPVVPNGVPLPTASDPPLYVTYLTRDGEAGFPGIIHGSSGPIPAQAVVTSPALDATNISAFTDLVWTPSPLATLQDVYLGTDTGALTQVLSGGAGSVTTVTTAQIQAALGGILSDSTVYYWKVVTNGQTAQAVTWSFTTGSATAHGPYPADGARETRNVTTMLPVEEWAADPVAAVTKFDVFFGTDSVAVGNGTATKYNPTPQDANTIDLPISTPGTWYYWRVDTYYGTVYRPGPVWRYRTVSRKISINTDAASGSVDGVPGLVGVIDDANVTNFSFSSFSYSDGTYDITVSGKRALSIQSDTSIEFNGYLDVTGGTARDASHAGGAGKSGGYDGGGDQTGTTEFPFAMTDSKNGLGHGFSSMIPNPVGTVYVNGGGAGYGGEGGSCGRYAGGFGGPGGGTYGQPELYALLGGSGGAGGGRCGGGGGGGAVEFLAKNGNITIGSLAQITANGGINDLPTDYPGGAGSGGAVRLAASQNVYVAGIITANGAAGGDRGAPDPCDTGGGGGGGRVAIYKGGIFNNTGTMTVAGGRKGQDTTGAGNSNPGKDGTIYTSGKTSDLFKAHGIAPADKYMGWNVADPTNRKVSWYPAISSTENKLYLGTSSTLTTPVATYTDPNGLRAMKTYEDLTLTANTKYYWRVDHKYGSGSVVTGDVWTFGTGVCSAVAGDLNGDCKVTFVDFAILAGKWGL